MPSKKKGKTKRSSAPAPLQLPVDAVRRKVLAVFGGSEANMPAVVAGRKLGFHVVVLDSEHSPPSVEIADEFLCVDLNDEDGVFAALDKHKDVFTGALTAADFPVTLVARTCKRYNTCGPTVDAAQRCTNKRLVNQALSEAGIKCPIWTAAATAADAFAFCNDLRSKHVTSVVLKPLESSGGRSITALKLDDSLTLAAVQAAFTKAAGSNRQSADGAMVMVEEMVQGYEVFVEILSLGVAEARVVAITSQQSSGPPFWHSQPHTKGVVVEIEQTALSVLRTLGITFSTAHVKIKVRLAGGKPELVVMKAACRLKGTNLPFLEHRTTGVDVVYEAVRIASGDRTSLSDISYTKAMAGTQGVQRLSLQTLTSFYDFRGKHVLDIGCGFGDLLMYIPRSSNTKYTGVDVAPEMIERARNRVNPDDPRDINFLVADFLQMDVADDTYDFVIGEGLFNFKLSSDDNHEEFRRALIAKAYRVSKDGCAFSFLSAEGVDCMDLTSQHNYPKDLMELAYTLTTNITCQHFQPYRFALFLFPPDRWQGLHAQFEPVIANKFHVLTNRRDYVAPNQIKYAHLASTHLSTNGLYTRGCEWMIQQRLGQACRKALLMPSCTAALEIAAMACEFQPGDEVILPSYTFTSTANAVVRCGATCVFVDVDPITLNISPAAIEAAITPRTKAIFVVHYAGVACEMDEIMAIAARRKPRNDEDGIQFESILVIEDAAHAFGASYKGKPLGSIGNMGCFSFHYTKNVVCGEGGALTVNAVHAGGKPDPTIDDLFAKVMILQEKGTNRHDFINRKSDKYWWIDCGSSFLISEPTAAILLSQLEVADQINQARVAVHHWYREMIMALPAELREGFTIIKTTPDRVLSGHIFFLFFKDPDQQEFVRIFLSENKVEALGHYLPLHSAPAGTKFGRACGDMSVTSRAAKALLRLPMQVQMTREDAARVVDLLAKACEKWVNQERPKPSKSPLPQEAKEEKELYLRDVHELSLEDFKKLVSDGAKKDEIRQNMLAGDVYWVRDALPRDELLATRSYLKSVGTNSLPNYQQIAEGAPNNHHQNANDHRAFVKGCFHQFSFFPWNQDVLGLFNLFRPIFQAKNILSNQDANSFMGTSVDHGCAALLRFQHYPAGIGHLAKHADTDHQLVVPLVLMTDKGENRDFSQGGAYLEREDGTQLVIDDLGGVGSVFFTNGKVKRGVKAIDPLPNYEERGADEIRWLDFKGRWTAECFVKKIAGNSH